MIIELIHNHNNLNQIKNKAKITNKIRLIPIE